jgi:hypothetical protein
MDPTNVGFLKWNDLYENMETELRKSVKIENKLYNSELNKSINKEELKKLVERNIDYNEEHRPVETFNYPLKNPKVCIQTPRLQDGYKWKWSTSGDWKEVEDIDVSNDGNTVAFTVNKRGANYTLSIRGKTHSWTHTCDGGPNVAIIGSRVFFIESDTPLHYTRLVSIDLERGGDRVVLFDETNAEIELDLVRTSDRGLFLLTYRAGIQSLYHVRERSFTQLSSKGVAFFPIGEIKSEAVYFVREEGFTAPWKLVGCNWELNSRIRGDGIEFCSLADKILITKFYGVRTIWKMGSRAEKIYSGIFEVAQCMKFLTWLYERIGYVLCVKPGSAMYKIDFKDAAIERPAIKYGLLPECGISISSDNLPVRWALLRPATKPVGLVCTVYGAYGLTTNLNTTRWRLWIDAGWAISFLFIRGGGDGNEMWADLGRLEGKKRAFNDTEACIRTLQNVTGVRASNTVIFGRSAGGLIVGNMAARWPRGNLFGIIYTEAPYVDLLKTASNPKLPLTIYEYKEFGNPRAGPAEFESTFEISPIHQLGSEGAPGIKVLCRTGLHDIQVYPYESLKWITALRGKRKDDNKLLFIDNDGHYSNKSITENTCDFVIINNWVLNQ